MDFAAFLSNLGNNLGFGLIVTLIGMLTVFFGLVLLIGLIKLMENATANLGKGGKRPKGIEIVTINSIDQLPRALFVE